MKELMLEVNDLIGKNDIVRRHSYFQIKNFIVNSEPTHQARLHKILIELSAKKSNIESMHLQRQDLMDDRDMLKVKEEMLTEDIKKNISDKLVNKLKEIEKRKISRQLIMAELKINELNVVIDQTADECRYYLELFKKMSIKEPIKEWDDPIVQKEYWDAKLGKDVYVRLVSGLPLSDELVKTVMSLPEGSETRKMLEEKLNQVKAIES